jgi:hypothetical protein
MFPFRLAKPQVLSVSLTLNRKTYVPGQNSTKFEMVVNLATAKSLGLVIPLRFSSGPTR